MRRCCYCNHDIEAHTAHRSMIDSSFGEVTCEECDHCVSEPDDDYLPLIEETVLAEVVK